MTLVLHEGLEQIGENAFYGCRGLTRVEIPLTVKDIDGTGVMTLVLHEGLERIGKDAFRECE
eukprot:scaffold17069_cov49-Cylindrotheca_fusiformis.AAC.1